MRRKKEIEPKKSVKEKISNALDLPKEITLNLPKMTVVGNGELILENYKGIIEYTENIVRLNTSSHMLKITGNKLNIKNITDEEIQLTGRINKLELEL